MCIDEIALCTIRHCYDGDTIQSRQLRPKANCFISRMGRYDQEVSSIDYRPCWMPQIAKIPLAVT